MATTAENRAKVLEALRTESEDRRCGGTIFGEHGKTCLIGLAAEALGIVPAPISPNILDEGDGIDVYALVNLALGVSEVLLYRLNDNHRSTGVTDWTYSWPEIADKLEAADWERELIFPDW